MANILVVENDRSMRLLTSARLSDTYNVICACNGSRELLQYLWLNLLSNAIKYTPSGGEITLTLRREDENAVVTLRDTGEGMSERTQKNLFTPLLSGRPMPFKTGTRPCHFKANSGAVRRHDRGHKRAWTREQI